jgi:hypothetical protein
MHITSRTGSSTIHKQALFESVPRYAKLLVKPLEYSWLNARYCDTFKHFQWAMPSKTKIYEYGGNIYPEAITMPKKVKARGIPKTKCLKTVGQQGKAKMRAKTGHGLMDKHQQCSCCHCVGQVKLSTASESSLSETN